MEKTIEYTNEKYGCINKYVIMPNHIHIIIIFNETDRHGNLSLQDVVARIKSFTTMKYNRINSTKPEKLWQRSYHDHVIRNEKSYQDIWEYIDTNQVKWNEDCYYI